jgi:hypothetical protein
MAILSFFFWEKEGKQQPRQTAYQEQWQGSISQGKSVEFYQVAFEESRLSGIEPQAYLRRIPARAFGQTPPEISHQFASQVPLGALRIVCRLKVIF